VHLDNLIVSALLLLAVTSVAVALFRHLGLDSVLGLLAAGVAEGNGRTGARTLVLVVNLSAVFRGDCAHGLISPSGYVRDANVARKRGTLA
jgi:Kef-type K+ transport system membrane component KefB